MPSLPSGGWAEPLRPRTPRAPRRDSAADARRPRPGLPAPRARTLLAPLPGSPQAQPTPPRARTTLGGPLGRGPGASTPAGLSKTGDHGAHASPQDTATQPLPTLTDPQGRPGPGQVWDTGRASWGRAAGPKSDGRAVPQHTPPLGPLPPGRAGCRQQRGDGGWRAGTRRGPRRARTRRGPRRAGTRRGPWPVEVQGTGGSPWTSLGVSVLLGDTSHALSSSGAPRGEEPRPQAWDGDGHNGFRNAGS